MKKIGSILPLLGALYSNSAQGLQVNARRIKRTPYKICPVCGNYHKHHNYYCSPECCRIHKEEMKAANKARAKRR